MKVTLKTLTMLLSTLLLLSLTNESIKVVSANGEGAKLDLFTQKVPFDGVGSNQSSDAFQPQELVVLYALVTYNDLGIPNKLVGFQTDNPANPFQNITIVGTSATNDSGIAEFSFRIPWPAENAEQIIFGEWHSIATVDVAGNVVLDTLSFSVGWIVQITHVTILDIQLEPQTRFPKGETIVFNLTIQNIAFTPKTATIILDAQDTADYPIIHVATDSIFPSGQSYMYLTAQIPVSAIIGEAIASAALYTARPEDGGIPYSPSFTTLFQVLAPRQYYLAVMTSPPDVAPISGEGWYDEGLNVTLPAPDYVSISSVARYKFLYWHVDGTLRPENPVTVVMNANHTATAYYIVQYYLSVKTAPPGIATIEGQGWYDQMENVSLAAPTVQGYDFAYWDVDGVSRSSGIASITVLMDAPHNATAHYNAVAGGWYPPYWFYWVFPFVLVPLLLLILLLYRRRRKREVETFYSGWTAWYYRYSMPNRDTKPKRR